MKKKLLVLLICFALVRFTYAAEPINQRWYYIFSDVPYATSQQGACDKSLAKVAASFPTVVSTQYVSTSNLCWYYDSKGAGRATYTVSSKVDSRCADGTAPNTSKPLAQQCEDPCPAAFTPGPLIDVVLGWRTGPLANSAWASGPNAGAIGADYCFSSCTVHYNGVLSYKEWVEQESSANGYYKGGVRFGTAYTGKQCTGSEADPSSVPPAPTKPPPEKNRCPRDTVQTGIDSSGIPICQGNTPKPSGEGTTQTKPDVTNPDGSKTQTTTTKTKNSDGSETSQDTTKTTNPDGTVTETVGPRVTGKTPDGKDGKDDSSADAKNDLCKQNPDLNICKNSQVSGQCESVSCTGDAIQCAIYRDQAIRNCKAQQDADAIKSDPAHALGEQAMNGNDPLASSLPSPQNALQVPMPSALDSSGWLGGGACFPDKQFTVQGRTITLSFTQACQPLIAFRYALMIIALLISFRMLSGVIFRE